MEFSLQANSTALGISSATGSLPHPRQCKAHTRVKIRRAVSKSISTLPFNRSFSKSLPSL
jgi:hypothetical protein